MLKFDYHKLFCYSRIVLCYLALSFCLLARDSENRNTIEKTTIRDYHISKTANVWTILTNWGSIGDLGFPPGFEWPGGSNNNYLFEAGLWIAGKDQNGNIHCTVQFFDDEEEYQPTLAMDDTIFLYNSNHSNFKSRPNVDSKLKGSQVSAEDTYAEYNDLDASKHGTDQSPLGVKIIERTYKWTASYNDDFIIFDYQIINIGLDSDQDLVADSTQKLSEVYVGMWVDADVSQKAEGFFWDDDLTAYYPDKQLSYIYDGDNPYLPGNDEGENGLSLGYIYARLLKSSGPGSVSYSEPHSHSWWILGNDPDSDLLRFNLMATPNFADPPPTPNDVRFVQATGPYEMEPNDTVNVVWAMGVGNGLSNIILDSDWARRIFDAGYLAATAPDAPQLSVEKGEGSIKLYWDDAAENSLDPLTGQNDFEGYRLYKSRTVDDLGNKIWVKLADFDQVNAIGANTGLAYEFIDTDVLNAYSYTYAITAYDQGEPKLGLDILESNRRESQALQNVTIGDPPKNTVDDIYVYPNPYVGSVEWDHIPTNDEPFERKLVFANLPEGEVKIKIFTLAGDLIDTVEQNNGESIAIWDMITQYNRKLVSGIYMYSVETEIGTHIGKFVVIQ